ncbi:E3 ubiquitin-protein ligase RNF103 isoform X4 [Ictidomys tridecemlineatus]
MWLKLFFLLLYFLVLFVLARFFEAIVWYETGIFATQLVDPVALSFRKLKTILECRGLGYSGLPEKKDVRELVEKSGDLMEGELYSALKEEEASESVSSTNFSGEMHFYELVEDTKDGIWLVQVIANDRSPLVSKIHWEKMVKKVSRFGIRTGTFNCSSDPRTSQKVSQSTEEFCFHSVVIGFILTFKKLLLELGNTAGEEAGCGPLSSCLSLKPVLLKGKSCSRSTVAARLK